MDKNAIKKYAVWARRELIARVSQKAEQYGITEKEIIDERAESIHGVVLTPAQRSQRQALIHLIRRDGYQQAMEEVAYTWFNRFIALRFMEVNDYLPGHTRAFTDYQNAFKPKILSDALNLELTELDLDKVIELKETNKTEELYQYLLITLCNHLSSILPGMFQRIDDYTELLFPEHLLREGSVLEQLVSSIPQDDWLDAVQIIGWLYQYYNAEPKDQVFANLKKNIKISKESIPAATQLFTPDWIVRYMVENSLGRLWVEGHPNNDLKSSWKYYLEEAEQEPEAQAQLQTIRSEYAQMKPEDILCIDPCSGSGHILVYLFDVLVQIYEAYGYPTRDAIASIVENNLWGLDIDDRAAQLAYFAVMMKARQYDKGWFRRGIEPHVFALQDSPAVNEEFYARFGDKAGAARRVIEAFVDAKEYGSIIQPNVTLEELDALQQVLVEQDQMSSYGSLSTMAVVADMIDTMYPLLRQARTLVQKYHVVVTNPPYMSASNMSTTLSKYIQKMFPSSKSDFCTVFIERIESLCRTKGFIGLMTSYTWMFLSTYELFRKELLENCSIITLVQPEYHAFFDSAYVPICTFVLCKEYIPAYIGGYVGLNEFYGSDIQQIKYLEAIAAKECTYLYRAKQDDFANIPGKPIVYSVSANMYEAFNRGMALADIAEPKQGLITGDNDRYLRLWHEVSVANSALNRVDGAKWYPINKGGEYRRWYGNREYVIDWENDGYAIKHFIDEKGKLRSRPQNLNYNFKEALSWSLITSGGFSVRYFDENFLFNVAGISCFPDNDLLNWLCGLLNTSIVSVMTKIINPTLNMNAGDVAKIPVLTDDRYKQTVDSLVSESIALSRFDWDSFENSWDFKVHPIVRWSRWLRDATSTGATMSYYYGCHPEVHSTVELCYMLWQGECNERFKKLKANEEELNRIFIDIYGLQDELTPEVAEKDVTVRKADLGRDVRSLISYAVGCMLGRYSLDKDGLTFAGGEWDASQYHIYLADKDGVLPITDDEYFADDVVSMFVGWVKTVFGQDDLEENLKYIASALYPNGGGTARELIRQYFLNDFYKDHLKIYQKRPIYWLFDAGKKNSFKCLIYLHRYQPDTVARVRTDYVHEMQARYRTAIDDLAHRVDTVSGSERVRLQKQLVKIQGQKEELRKYEEKIHHYADMMLSLDLDDGVKVNYAKLQDVLATIK